MPMVSLSRADHNMLGVPSTWLPGRPFSMSKSFCINALKKSRRRKLRLEERGHRPPLPAGPEQPEDWPLVSVVVTSFNYGRFVMDAVDSVLAQTFKDLEVIVVEGGSSNPTSRLVVAALQRP